MENYRCERCKMNIPIGNQIIHSLRCSVKEEDVLRNKDNNLSIGSKMKSNCVDLTGADDENDETESEWVCIICTLQNSRINDSCLACGNIKNIDTISNPNSSNSSEIMWICTKCTFHNNMNESYCQVCLSSNDPEPPIHSFRDTLIPPSPPESPNLSNNSYPSSSQLRHSSSLRQSMILGAGVGAGLAWLNGRNISQGAVAGASLGAISDLMMNQIFDEDNEDEIDYRQIQNRRVAAQEMDVDNMSYEDLLNRFHTSPRKSHPQILQNLPVWKCNNSSRESNETTQCSICLGTFEPGENIKSLPCLHSYHSNCIDTWLSQHHHICPVCKYDVDS